MANPEHLRILMQGVNTWNEWRSENPSEEPDLSDAVLDGMGFKEWHGDDYTSFNLMKVNLSRASLIGANLAGVNLMSANLEGANLEGANLSVSAVSQPSGIWYTFGAAMADAKLCSAKLGFADLSFSDFTNANFSHVSIGMTRFGSVDLSTVIGLDLVEHISNSIIGIETVFISRGKIPDIFLRGCGIPEEFIIYAKSLVWSAFEFYSCFISYSIKDQHVANRIYRDLQHKAVRCWFAPEDLKIGDKFRQHIDESIHFHDKLLLILSEHSIASPWVEEEVESALERERKESRLILFPISIDDAVWHSEKAWVASLRRMRHIGDFKNWNRPEIYNKSFERLLRDLKLKKS